MKLILPVLLLLPLLAGCATLERLDSIRSSAEKLIEDSVQSAALETGPTDGSLLTKAEVERIALTHSGLNRGQVSRMKTSYELEDGRHQYEVEFHQGPWEHSYEIDAETGEILSWDREKEEGAD